MKEGLEILAERLIARTRKESPPQELVGIIGDEPYDRKINGTTTAVGFGRSCTPNDVTYILTDI